MPTSTSSKSLLTALSAQGLRRSSYSPLTGREHWDTWLSPRCYPPCTPSSSQTPSQRQRHPTWTSTITPLSHGTSQVRGTHCSIVALRVERVWRATDSSVHCADAASISGVTHIRTVVASLSMTWMRMVMARRLNTDIAIPNPLGGLVERGFNNRDISSRLPTFSP